VPGAPRFSITQMTALTIWMLKGDTGATRLEKWRSVRLSPSLVRSK
jgi:hypothetical protein